MIQSDHSPDTVKFPDISLIVPGYVAHLQCPQWDRHRTVV